MEQEGFKVGSKVLVRTGAEISSDNGSRVVKQITHQQTIVIEQLLDRNADQTLLICWRENGVWLEAKAEDCAPIPEKVGAGGTAIET